MKKILTLFAVIGLFAFSGCSDDDNDNIDYDTISYVLEVENVNFSANSNSEIFIDFDSQLYLGDVVLVYRYAGTSGSGKDVWTILPDSHYYTNGSLYFSYKFDFSQDDVKIYTEGFGLGANPIPADLRNNQIFRIVVVPGEDPVITGKSTNKVDYSDYYEVIKKYNIDDSNVKKIN